MITCSRCHVEKDETEFYLREGGPARFRRCKDCYRAVARECYHKRTPEQREARKEAHRETVRAYRARNIDKVRRAARGHHLKKSYGLTPFDEQAMLEIQSGKCGICRAPLQPGTRDMSVDHCHHTGQVRGLLCNSCNLGLGYFKDNVASLQRAVVWLIKHDDPSRMADIALIYTLEGRKLREQNALASMAR